jgi:hypothetical protein
MTFGGYIFSAKVIVLTSTAIAATVFAVLRFNDRHDKARKGATGPAKLFLKYKQQLTLRPTQINKLTDELLEQVQNTCSILNLISAPSFAINHNFSWCIDE